MYRLYHEVELSTGFIHRGLKAPRCVNRVEADTMGYVAMTTHLSVATMALAIKGSSYIICSVQQAALDRS